ncbi:unnamed protein product, partial [Adineta steineri]
MVSTAISPNGWCAKMSTSSSSNAIVNRDIDSGVCAHYNYNGCEWRLVNNVLEMCR